jgi:MtfA peptidase
MFVFKRWRRRRLADSQFPADWLLIIERDVRYYGLLPAEDKEELRKNILIFLSEKRFEGCGGLEITEQIKVTITAMACILLLHRETDYYPGLTTILVYPEAYVAHQVEHLASGVVAEGPNVRLGESWQQGTVVLSWDDVYRDAQNVRDGHNVVFHEFAHQIDSSQGRGDSSEVLQDMQKFIRWARILRNDYEKLRSQVTQNQHRLLDEYGSINAAEFFAVATETFFEKPKEMKQIHPELYEELKRFYHQDPVDLFNN